MTPVLSYLPHFSLLLALACTPQRPAHSGEQARDPREDAIQYRASARRLAQNEFASEISVEIDRIDSWLRAAEASASSPDVDARHLVDLQLRAAQGLLVELQSYVTRREAERAHERASAEFVRVSARVSELESRTTSPAAREGEGR